MRYFFCVFLFLSGASAQAGTTSIEAVRAGLGDFQAQVVEAVQAIPKLSERDPLSSIVSVHVRKAGLTEFLAVISGQANVSFWVPADIITFARPVTAEMDGVAAREALSSALEAQGLTYRRREDAARYYLVMRDPLAVLLNVGVESATMAEFLSLVAKQSGVRFTLAEGVQTRPVSARFLNVTARSAVKTVAASQGLELWYAEDGKTYVLRAKR